MSEKIKDFKWEFPFISNGIPMTGVDGFDSFQFHGIESVVREAVQNSIDADDQNTNEPVKVLFRFFKQKASDIPGYSELKERTKKVYEYAEDNGLNTLGSTKELSERYNQNDLICLEITDENTTGITDKSTGNGKSDNWMNYMKAVGMSSKTNAAGSKGLGKAAFVSYSNQRLIFVETYNGKQWHALGKACFPSGYYDSDQQKDDVTHGPGVLTLENIDDLTDGIDFINCDRDKTNPRLGTSLYIIDIKTTNNPDKINDEFKAIIESVLESYIYAIYNGKLEINVEDLDGSLITINKVNLEDIIDEFGNDIIKQQYDCLKNGVKQVIRLKEELPNIIKDDSEIHLYYKSDITEKDGTKGQRVNIRYPGMFIKKDNLNISLAKNSMIVVVIGSGEVSEIYSAAEDPSHKKWSANNIQDRRLRFNFNQVENHLSHIIDQFISTIEKENIAECTELYGSKEFLKGIRAADDQRHKKDEKDSDVSQWTNFDNEHIKDTTIQDEEEVSSEIIRPEIGELDESQEGDFVHPTENPLNSINSEMNKPGPGNANAIEGDNLVYKRVETHQSMVKYFADKQDSGVDYIVAFKNYDGLENNFRVCIAFKDVNEENIKDIKVDNVSVKQSENCWSPLNFIKKTNGTLEMNVVPTVGINEYMFVKIKMKEKFEMKAEVNVYVEQK